MSLARGGEVVGDNCSEEITVSHTCETRKRMRDCATECVGKLKVQPLNLMSTYVAVINITQVQ